jgi:hypothetical protein
MLKTTKLGILVLTLGVALMLIPTVHAGKGSGSPTPVPTATAGPSGPYMYIDVLNVNAWVENARTLGGACLVRVVDQTGAPVAGANVTIQWSGVASGVASGLTNAPHAELPNDIYATINTTVNGKCSTGPKVFTCTVVNVTKSGLNWDSSVPPIDNEPSDDACQ